MGINAAPLTVSQRPRDGVKTWLDAFAAALDRRDIAGVTELFAEECYWRDLVAFSWDIVTFEGRSAIAAMLAERLDDAAPGCWRLMGEPSGDGEAIESFITFETRLGRCKGLVRLRDGKCWTLLTTLYELKGFEEPVGARRPVGAPQTLQRGEPSWGERRGRSARELGDGQQPYVLIVGGGQGGLGLGARLKMLDVPTLIIDRLAEPGAQWRSRYRSLCLHDPVWYDHLPYVPFPQHWPVFTPKDKMADWLKAYAGTMELDLWNSTECVDASYDVEKDRWRVKVLRDGIEVTLHPTQLVFALGGSGKPHLPVFAGADSFAGGLIHSSQYRGDEPFAGRRVTVIGSNNSAHDICADLRVRGFEPTMIQRSSTLVVRSKTLMDVTMRSLYSEEAVAAGVTTEIADLILASMPLRALPAVQKPLVKEIRDRDAEFYARLRSAGFMLDFGDDDSGLYMKYLRTASGYYIDVGASEMIIDGRIKLRSGVGVTRIEPGAVVLSDGTSVASDAIVCATGFGSMDEWVRTLISGEAAHNVGRCWGYGSGVAGDPGPWEGELRSMWKPTAQRGLWFHGGNLHFARHYSLYLALQLKARFEGLEGPWRRAA